MKTKLSKWIAYSVIFAFVAGLIIATAPRAVVGSNSVNTGTTEAVITQTLDPAAEYTSSNPIKDSTDPYYGCTTYCSNGRLGYIASGRCVVCF